MTNNVISLFSGALGLDLGLEAAGFNIKVAIEKDKWAVETIKLNRPDIEVISKPIQEVTSKDILKRAGLTTGNVKLVVGGPSCQSFSTAGSRRSIDDPRGGLFREFIRVVNDVQPRFFLMENVKGMLSAANIHRPLAERGPGFPPLTENEELGSAFRLILRYLKSTGYYTIFGVLNSADYGVPQKRERLIVIGSRDGEALHLPPPTHSKNGVGEKKHWVNLRAGLNELQDNKSEYRSFSPNQIKYLNQIPPGGNWQSLPENQHEEAIGGAYNSWGGRTGFLRRLSWNNPSPALITNPNGKATLMCHPDELRPLTVREYARLQQFPDNWKFAGNISQKYIQVGNAVPIGLGSAIGKSLLESIDSSKSFNRLGVVKCPDPELIKKISIRPKTILNPPRMRKDPSAEAAEKWLGKSNGNRGDIYKFMEEIGSNKKFSNTNGLIGYLPNQINVLRWKAHRITIKLKTEYGKFNPKIDIDLIDELANFIYFGNFSGSVTNCDFNTLKSLIVSWSEVESMHLAKFKSLIKNFGLSLPRTLRIREILRKIKFSFGELTLVPLYSMSDELAETFLISLPGIGIKSAKLILMNIFNRQVFPVDSNVFRVSQRLGLIEKNVALTKMNIALGAVVAPTNRIAYHVNGISHGRSVCHVDKPDCNICKLKRNCKYFRELNVASSSS